MILQNFLNLILHELVRFIEPLVGNATAKQLAFWGTLLTR